MCLYVSQSKVYVIDFITFHLDMCLATAKSGLIHTAGDLASFL